MDKYFFIAVAIDEENMETNLKLQLFHKLSIQTKNPPIRAGF